MSALETAPSGGLLKQLGVRIRRVAELDESWLLILDRKLLLVDFETADEDIPEMIDRVLSELFKERDEE